MAGDVETVQVSFFFDKRLLRDIDRARGHMPRAVFVRELLRNALKAGIRIEGK